MRTASRRHKLSTHVRRLNLLGLTRRRNNRWRAHAETTQAQLVADISTAWDGTFSRLDTPAEDRHAAWELWYWAERVAESYERDIDAARGRDWPAIAESRSKIYRRLAKMVRNQLGDEEPPAELFEVAVPVVVVAEVSSAERLAQPVRPQPQLLWILPDGGTMSLKQLRRAGPIIHTETCIEHPGAQPAIERSYLSESEWERTKQAIRRVAERLGGVSEPEQIGVM